MKKLLISLFKGLLILSVCLFLLFLVVGIVLVIDLPWWAGFFIFSGLMGVWIGGLFLKKLWLKKKEQQFVNQLIESDDAYASTLGDTERSGTRDLQDRWKEAIEALQKSHLRKQGNPLYVLPWYMIIGESGTGKTTAIKSARLSSSFADVSATSGISGTRNCDWWFFEKAIILDTAGRYAIPVDEGRDREEWHRFLTLLAKFRKKEPLNGLVITVAADKLLNPVAGSLEEDGKTIRRRIDELMKVIGARFPVYVLVTKCDLIRGMTDFCDQITEKNHDQAMGAINQDLSEDTGGLISRAMERVEDRLKDLRLLLLGRPADRNADRAADVGLMVFPEEYKKLKSGLEAFVRGAFLKNPYQESPILRGVFFSSGKQEGSPFSYFLKDLGLIDQKEVLPGTDKGLFLHDFFSKILPADRRLYAPTTRSAEWSRLTRNMGLTAWLAIAIAVCGLLTFSFVKNLKTLRDVSREFMKPSMMQGELVEDTIFMDRFREAVLRVENQNRNWWIPRLGLNESLSIEAKLKSRYCRQYRTAFLTAYDDQMFENMAGVSAETPDAVMARYVAHLARRINLLRARMAGERLDDLLDHPQPVFNTVAVGEDAEMASDVNQKLTSLYHYFLIWQAADKEVLTREVNDLQAWLKHLLTLDGGNLNWLIPWANADTALASVHMADFWGGSPPQAGNPSVSSAFTAAGKEKIDGFLAEIEAALYDPLIIADKKMDFEKWYPHAYVTAWHDFAERFPEGRKTLEDKAAWKRVVDSLGSDRDPYLALFAKMALELAPFEQDSHGPDWMRLIDDFQKIRIQAAALEAVSGEKKGILEKASKKVVSTFDKIEKSTGISATAEIEGSDRMVGADAFRDYRSAIQEMIPASSARRFAYELAVEMGADPEATAPDNASAAIRAWQAKTLLLDHLIGPGMTSQLSAMADLIAGPLDFMHEFIFRETACHLQDTWASEVLLPARNAPADQDPTLLLMGEQGLARRFIEGPARPFIGQNLDGRYYAKEIFGRQIAFHDLFLSFITKGAAAARLMNQTYSVFILSDPTGANQDARIRPHATTLEMRCAPEGFQLVNHNYPVSKTVDWSAATCNDVTLKIDVGSTVLTKEYKGYLGFARFIKEFENDQRVFFPREFPVEEWALKGMGVKYITVKYQFKNHQPVLDILRSAPGDITEEIAPCWE